MITLDELKKQITETTEIKKFFEMCNEGAATPAKNWFFATVELEKSLDTFMQQLAGIDKITAIKFSTIFVRYAFSYVLENHLEQVHEIGFAFLASDKCRDGKPIEKQLLNVEKWLDAPTPKNMEMVRKRIDPPFAWRLTRYYRSRGCYEHKCCHPT